MQYAVIKDALTTSGCTIEEDGTVLLRSKPLGVLTGSGFRPAKSMDEIPLGEIADVSMKGSKLSIDMGEKGSKKAEPEDVVIRQPPADITEMANILPELYDGLTDMVYYDVLSEQAMIDPKLFSHLTGSGNETVSALVKGLDTTSKLSMGTDNVPSLFHYSVVQRLKDKGYYVPGVKGSRAPPKELMDDALGTYFALNRRNLFREWLESLKWDGEPRLRTWFQNIIGATAPGLSKEEEDEYIGAVTEAWFIAAIRRQYIPTKTDTIIVLIGDQALGKSTACEYTCPKPEWFISTAVKLDEPQKFLESIRGHVIVEFGESKSLKTDPDDLKAFLSKPSDQLRKAYGHSEAVYPRHFSFIATSNRLAILTDTTGNRRFYPFMCTFEATTQRYTGAYAVEQVWAEAMAYFRANGVAAEAGAVTIPHPWFIGKDSPVYGMAERMQDYCTEENTGISMIDEWLDDMANGYNTVGSRVTKQTIMENVFSAMGLPKDDQDKAYRDWTDSNFKYWKKIQGSVRINGKVARGWERIRAPGDRAPNRTSRAFQPMDSKSKEDMRHMYNVMTAFALTLDHDPVKGEPFDASALSEDDVRMLLSAGFIRQPDATKAEYEFYAMPSGDGE